MSCDILHKNSVYSIFIISLLSFIIISIHAGLFVVFCQDRSINDKIIWTSGDLYSGVAELVFEFLSLIKYLMSSGSVLKHIYLEIVKIARISYVTFNKRYTNYWVDFGEYVFIVFDCLLSTFIAICEVVYI